MRQSSHQVRNINPTSEGRKCALRKTITCAQEYTTCVYIWGTSHKLQIRNILLTTVRTRHGTTDWFQIGNGTSQGCILSPCLFNLNAECIMWNARLAEAKAEIKIARRNISNLRYADDTILMAESKEELKSLDEGERGEWKSWLETQHSKR